MNLRIPNHPQYNSDLDAGVWVNAYGPKEDLKNIDKNRIEILRILVKAGASLLIVNEKNELPHQIIDKKNNPALHQAYLQTELRQAYVHSAQPALTKFLVEEGATEEILDTPPPIRACTWTNI